MFPELDRLALGVAEDVAELGAGGLLLLRPDVLHLAPKVKRLGGVVRCAHLVRARAEALGHHEVTVHELPRIASGVGSETHEVIDGVGLAGPDVRHVIDRVRDDPVGVKVAHLPLKGAVAREGLLALNRVNRVLSPGGVEPMLNGGLGAFKDSPIVLGGADGCVNVGGRGGVRDVTVADEALALLLVELVPPVVLAALGAPIGTGPGDRVGRALEVRRFADCSAERVNLGGGVITLGLELGKHLGADGGKVGLRCGPGAVDPHGVVNDLEVVGDERGILGRRRCEVALR